MKEKLSAYEAGMSVIPGPNPRILSDPLLIVAMLFLVFDIELVLLYQ